MSANCCFINQRNLIIILNRKFTYSYSKHTPFKLTHKKNLLLKYTQTLKNSAIFIPEIKVITLHLLQVITLHLQTNYLKNYISYVSLFGFQVIQMFFKDHFRLFINSFQFIGVELRGEGTGHFIFMRELLLFSND